MIQDTKRYYWRLKNSLKERGSIGYLNIIEGGEAIMIYDRLNNERYQTLITIKEFEEIQDRFKLDRNEYVKEPEGSIPVELITSCDCCPLENEICGGWDLYRYEGKGSLPCFDWRNNDVVVLIRDRSEAND